MVFNYEWDLIECKMWNWRLKFLSKCPCSWFGLLGLFFSVSYPNETHFLIGIHSMQGWTVTARHGVIRKEVQKD